MATSSPARLYCTLVGAALVIVGVIGFFYSSGFGTGDAKVGRETDEVFGLLAVNGWHNLVRIALGIVALIAAGSAARSYALGAGLLFLVLALWGWLDSDGIILGLIPLDSEDNVLNLVLGLTGVAAGAATRKATSKPRPGREGEPAGEPQPRPESDPAGKPRRGPLGDR
jgi:hypothetical protein